MSLFTKLVFFIGIVVVGVMIVITVASVPLGKEEDSTAYKEGYESGQNLIPVESCHYSEREEPIANKRWKKGWQQGYLKYKQDHK